MKQNKSKRNIIIIVIVMSMIFIGRGLYLWQKNKLSVNNQVMPTKETSFVSDSILNIDTLSFTLPEGWDVDEIITHQNKIGSWKIVKIKVPDPKYRVIMPMKIMISKHKIDNDTTPLLKKTSSGAEIYLEACAPAIACYRLVYNDKIYDIVFNPVESNQPTPENLDGIWFPDTIVTKDDTLNFLSTVK